MGFRIAFIYMHIIRRNLLTINLSRRKSQPGSRTFVTIYHTKGKTKVTSLTTVKSSQLHEVFFFSLSLWHSLYIYVFRSINLLYCCIIVFVGYSWSKTYSTTLFAAKCEFYVRIRSWLNSSVTVNVFKVS